MDNLVFKNQLTFIILTAMIAVFTVAGISVSRGLVNNISFSIETDRLTKPIEQYYNYRLSLAESNNQTILQTIIDPKKESPTVEASIINSIPVVVYHGIVEESDGENATLDQIKVQLYTLKDAGYKTISLEDYLLFTQGKKQLPEKSFLLTFDDGRKDSYEEVDPVLKALDYKAVMFVITEHVHENKNSFYLSADQLKSMQKSGRWDIQSHGKHAHTFYQIDEEGKTGSFYGNKLWLKEQNRLETTEEFKSRVQKDMADSKTDLEKLGLSPTTFAFPFGDYGQFSKNFPEAKEIVPYIAREIFTVSFYQTFNKANDDFSNQNYFAAEKAFSKRLTIKPEVNGIELISILEGGNKKELPYSDDFANPHNWQASWGLLNTENNTMLVSSTENTTGGSSFLRGATDWTNYKVDTNVSFLMGNTLSIHARVKDESNYLTCDFSDTQVQIEQKVNGQSSTIIKKKLQTPFDPANAKFSVVVNGPEVTCFVNDTEVAKTTKTKKADLSLDKGTIGFSTWDKEKANSAILVQSLSVSELQ